MGTATMVKVSIGVDRSSESVMTSASALRESLAPIAPRAKAASLRTSSDVSSSSRRMLGASWRALGPAAPASIVARARTTASESVRSGVKELAAEKLSEV